MEARLGPLKAIIEGSKVTLINEGEEPVYVERVELEYYYTVYMPDGRVARRRGSEKVLEKKTIKPGEVLKFDMGVQVSGIKALVLEGEELKSYEVVIE